jgi:hypothetical protein
MKELTVGDKVAYSVQFLKSIGMSHSDMAHARGVVTGIQFLSTSFILARIDWHGANLPDQVNVHNLALVGPNSRFCNV